MRVVPEKNNLSQPFFLRGGERACLLIHGFTGCPYEMRELGEFLNNRGYTVSVISLPGHGGSPSELEGIRAEDWINHVVDSYVALSQEYDTVFPIGLSMGALLVLILAGRFHEIKAGVLLSPALQLRTVNRFFIPFFRYFPPSYYYTKPEGSNILDPEAKKRHISYNRMPLRSIYEFYRLQKISLHTLTETKCSFLVIYSKMDGTVSEKGIKKLEEKGAGQLEKFMLYNSGHVITVDREKEQVFNKVVEFLNKN